MKRCAIIGGGISGLAAAYYLRKHSDAIQIDVYESQDRLGGVIKTEVVDGCILEAGPDSFLTQKTSAIHLCRELGLENALVASNDAHRGTCIFHEGKLKPLPDGFFLMVPTKIFPFLTTDLFSWPGKLNVLGDLVAFPEESDCTVAEFIERRFGTEVLQQIAEPMLSGIYGADVERLSLKCALPQIWEMQKRGSLIRSLLRRKAAPQESLFTTIAEGMETLPKALIKNCPDVRSILKSHVGKAEKSGPSWRIGENSYDILLIATASFPEIASRHGNEIRALINSVRRNSAVVVVLCFENLSREGFGWLVPAAERRSVLACTYLSNKFPRRSPQGRFLVRLFIGGKSADAWIDRSDADIYQEAVSELKRIAGIDQSPLFHRIAHWKQVMPEYEVGHDRKIEKVQELARQEKNLFLTGNLFSGIGIPDCIAHAEKVALQIASDTSALVV